MPFHPGVATDDTDISFGEVDYRLQRRRLLRDVERGIVDPAEVCDVHPELIRVARNVAPHTGGSCPLCSEKELRLVAYVFGPRLGPGGKCVVSDEELQRIARRQGDFVSYEVEVCATCGWNHLLRRYPLR
ncbi:MAG TPA: DUF5318 family protein [Acidimicrobiales bacterium]|nr:DUF5318 family protein [Acidimicrobiales bacterium]